VLRRSQHGVARDFRTRAGGGGDGDERRRRLLQRLAAADHLQVVERVAGVGQHGGQRLTGIHGAAAADADYQIAALRARVFVSVADHLDARLAGHRQRQAGDPGDFQAGHQRRRAIRRRARHHQRAAAQGGGGRGHLSHRALAKENARRRGELELHGHYQPWSAGKMLP
jgi:hypothetical protein